jgi:cellulose biosynthesis protein BcsQ
MTDADRRGQIITFYSFKGGVGRSMALANVAAIQAQRGRRVLVLDFDFDAPGLHRYFLTREGARYEPARLQKGMIDYFSALRDRMRANWPGGRGLQEPEGQRTLATLVGEALFGSNDYLYHVEIGNPNARDAPPAQIDFVPAARFDHGYPDLVRGFDWQGFYDDYAEVFPALAEEMAKRYDYVLIDSRAGVTDVGSICTMMLPDKLVLVFTPNDQSLRGALDAGWQAIQGRKQLPGARPLPIFPLVSRVEEGEHMLQREWIGRARRGFERLFQEAYEREAVDLETYFRAIRIPHRSFYAYGERLAAEDQASGEAGSLAQAYHRLASSLDSADAENAQRAESPS